MWDKVKSLGSRRRTNSIIKRHAMKRNGTVGNRFQKGKNANNFKVQVPNPKVIFSRQGLP